MGIPKAIASDDGLEWKGKFTKVLHTEGIENIVCTTHLSFIERFTRTIQNILFERIEHNGNSWHLLFPAVIKQDINILCSAIKLKLVDAIIDNNVIEVKIHFMLRSRFKRNNKEDNIDDYMRIFQKKM